MDMGSIGINIGHVPPRAYFNGLRDEEIILIEAELDRHGATSSRGYNFWYFSRCA